MLALGTRWPWACAARDAEHWQPGTAFVGRRSGLKPEHDSFVASCENSWSYENRRAAPDSQFSTLL